MSKRIHYITKICDDCGDEFEVANTTAHHCIRCIPCRKIREKEIKRLQRERAEHKAKEAHTQPMPYVMKIDPDHSWGIRPGDTKLALIDMQCMMKDKHLTPGTVFYNEQKKCSFEVVQVKNRQKLQYVEL